MSSLFGSSVSGTASGGVHTRASQLHLATTGSVERDQPRSAMSVSISVPPVRKVLIICTGGTIGMCENATGALEPRAGYFATVLSGVFAFSVAHLPEYDVLEWDPPIDSSNMRPKLWKQLIVQIEEAYARYSGFLILMGTDTMSYTASCISFAFSNLAKPIIFTGSQIPLSRAYTDARRHLLIGLMSAGHLNVPECCILFGNKLFRANRTKKKDNWGVAAYESPNLEPLGTFGINVKLNSHVRTMPRDPLRVFHEIFSNILVVWLVPGFDDTMLKRLVPQDGETVGVVLMLYGAGNAPDHSDQSFISALRALKEKGAEIVVASQCRKGSINLSSYSTGQQLLALDLINGKDMTIEACVTKLSFLMGRGYRDKKLKEEMEKDLRGELTPCSTNVEYTGIIWD